MQNPKPRISVSLYNDHGIIAQLENPAGFETVTLSLSDTNSDVPKICAEAAVRLRELAFRFEALAVTPNPLRSETQKKINHP